MLLKVLVLLTFLEALEILQVQPDHSDPMDLKTQQVLQVQLNQWLLAAQEILEDLQLQVSPVFLLVLALLIAQMVLADLHLHLFLVDQVGPLSLGCLRHHWLH